MVNLLKIYINLSIFSIFVMINIVSSFAQVNPSGEIMSEIERRYQTQQDVPTLANEMIQYSNQKYNASDDPIEKSFYSEIKKHFNSSRIMSIIFIINFLYSFLYNKFGTLLTR